MACRKKAGVFDVSHMGQIHIYGRDREKFLETFCTGDVKEMKAHDCLYSIIPNKYGGTIDDFLISKMPDFINIVVNAGTTQKDLKHINKKLEEYKDKNPGADVFIHHMNDRGLLAIQGPSAHQVLQRYIKESLVPFGFMKIGYFTMPRINEKVLLRRSGYTGEDGFEVTISYENIIKFYDLLLHDGNDILPCGLGARDTLRLESSLCLYGHELNDDITPIEAGLNWAIGKRRKKEGGFPGYEIIRAQMKKDGIDKKRVGLKFEKGCIPREHTDLVNENGQKIGIISSGTYSPSLKMPIAMAYVSTLNNGSKIGKKYFAVIRGKKVPCQVVKLPFVPLRYYRY
jgi:aminomethyltransferase